MTIGGPCAIDPPPGNFSTVHIANDTGNTVVVLDGEDSKCSVRSGVPQQLAAEQTTSCSYEMCAGGSIEITSGGLPLGCVSLPVGNPAKRPLLVSHAAPCATPAT